MFDFVLLPFRPWTPVFALLEHKYIDKKVRDTSDGIDSLYTKPRPTVEEGILLCVIYIYMGLADFGWLFFLKF